MISTLKKFFAFCSKENRRKFYLSIFLGVVSAFLIALKIPAIGILIKAIVGGNVTSNDIWWSFGIMLFSVIGASIVKYKSTMLQTEAGYGTACSKRIEIAEHMRYLPMGYFNKNSLGKIMSVTTNSMESLADVGTRAVMIVTEGTVTTVVITCFIIAFDWRIGLIVACGFALYLLANKLLQSKSREVSTEKVRTDTNLVERVIEYIKGIAEVKNYHLIGKYNKNLEKAIDENSNANTKMEFKLIPFMTLQNFIAKAVGVIVIIVSLLLLINSSMNLLNCIMMIVCSFMVMESMELAGNFSSLMRVVDLSVSKANEILSIKQMDIDGEDYEPKSANIKVENIEFSYEDKKIIDKISLDINEKTTTAIVGPSGGGKTTLCHLISRFWDVDGGRVTLDGKNIKEYSMDSLMKNFSFVFQNVYLFKDTVKNNIKFGRPSASDEEVVEIAKKAKCHDFIMKLEKGYDTVIGESGGNLSGGERQRISIARAMMKDSPIIILDEATANVDPENEKDLINAIEELTHNKTVIMIAHRLNTVRNADNIVVIDNGEIVEEGNHEKLIENNGLYSRFIKDREVAVSWKI